ncbi:MAG: SAVED domain-containing protein [Rhodothermales bacterium]
MLTCKKHGDLIDDLDLVEKYDEDLLRTFKREHEERVRILTDVRDDRQSHVVFFRAPVDGRDLTIDERKAHRALLPNYPAEEHPFDIDLAGIGIPSSSAGFYEVMREALKQQTGDLLRRRAGRSRPRSLSVFAIAPIPLLVQFGRYIGDVQSVDLYQHHRGPRSWSWADEEEEEVFYELTGPGRDDEHDSPLVVIISVSARVRPELVETLFDGAPIIYRLEATDVVEERVSGRDFLRSRTRLNVFAYEFRRLLDLIRSRHGHARPVHLFSAVPAPIAIEIGRNIKDVDPEFILYDYRKSTNGYAPAFAINSSTHS